MLKMASPARFLLVVALTFSLTVFAPPNRRGAPPPPPPAHGWFCGKNLWRAASVLLIGGAIAALVWLPGGPRDQAPPAQVENKPPAPDALRGPRNVGLPIALGELPHDEIFASYRVSEAQMHLLTDKVDAYFTQLVVRLPGGDEIPLSEFCRARRQGAIDKAISVYIMGKEKTYDLSFLDEALEGLKFPRDRVNAAIRAASEDPAIQRAIQQLAMNRVHKTSDPKEKVALVDVMQLLPSLIRHDEPALVDLETTIDGKKVPLHYVRPQQIELAHVVYQYTSTTGDDQNMLEVGYGSTSVMLSLHYLFRHVRFTGLEIDPAPARANELLEKFQTKLIVGDAPKDRTTVEAVKARGPYSAIFASDVFKPGFTPGVSNAEYLRFLKSMMAPGGVLLILNDFELDPFFTADEAKAAGLEIVRWRAPRELAPNVRQLFIRGGGAANTGKMYAFVLRNPK